jgi:hypothetical protein
MPDALIVITCIAAPVCALLLIWKLSRGPSDGASDNDDLPDLGGD